MCVLFVLTSMETISESQAKWKQYKVRPNGNNIIKSGQVKTLSHKVRPNELCVQRCLVQYGAVPGSAGYFCECVNENMYCIHGKETAIVKNELLISVCLLQVRAA